MSGQDIYVVIDRQQKGDYYVSDYSTGQGQVAVSELFRDARKFGKYEAEEVAEYFGMMTLKVNDISK